MSQILVRSVAHRVAVLAVVAVRPSNFFDEPAATTFGTNGGDVTAEAGHLAHQLARR